VDNKLSKAVLGAGLAGMAILGAVWSRDYGVSWDLAASVKLGRATLRSYQELRPPTEDDQLQDLARHGPWGVTVTEWATTWIRQYWPSRAEYQVQYFVQFLWFTVGAGVVFALARRWVKPIPALLASLLWASQPLLLGHGFIKPFDGSFITVFAAAVLAGYTYVDVLAGQTRTGLPPAWRDIRSEFPRAFFTSMDFRSIFAAAVSGAVLGLAIACRLIAPVADHGVSWSGTLEILRCTEPAGLLGSSGLVGYAVAVVEH
jgi:hypothetical protein